MAWCFLPAAWDDELLGTGCREYLSIRADLFVMVGGSKAGMEPGGGQEDLVVLPNHLPADFSYE